MLGTYKMTQFLSSQMVGSYLEEFHHSGMVTFSIKDMSDIKFKSKIFPGHITLIT